MQHSVGSTYSPVPYSREIGEGGIDVARRARQLGWFSLGLGLAEMLAPRAVARCIGVRDDDEACTTLRAFGVREFVSGAGILAAVRPMGWLWGRVAGDALDLGLLGMAIARPVGEPERKRTLGATLAVAGVTALDLLTAFRLNRGGGDRRPPQLAAFPSRIHMAKSITVNRPLGEVYAFFRNFENLPRFMAHLESVQVNGSRSRWRAKAPAGTSVEWEAEITMDRPSEEIQWSSTDGSGVPNRGSVRFEQAPGRRGTEVHVEVEYRPPAGKLGALVARLFGENPEQQVASDLRRFKQVMEVGEVVHSDASIHSGMHPARPAASSEMLDATKIGREP